MPTTIDSLELQITSSPNNAAKGIDALTASLKRLKSATKDGLGLTSVVNQLGDISKAIDTSGIDKLGKLSNTLGKLKSVKDLKTPSNISPPINEDSGGNITADNSDAVDSLNQYTSEVEQASNSTSRFKALLGSLGGAFQKNGTQSAESFLKHASNVDILNIKLDGAREKLHSLLNAETKNNSAIAGAISQVNKLQGELKSAQKEASIFRKIMSGIGAIGKGTMTGLTKGFKALGGSTMGKVVSSAKEGTSKFSQFFNSIKRIAMYRAVRAMLSALSSAIKEGVNNLYQYSKVMDGQFAGSLDRLATSFLYLKNSAGAMVSPLINALAPAVDFVIDKIVALMNVINQLFARLTGASSFTAAKKTATSFGGAVSSAGSAAKKAAKEIRDATIGIDELNIISKPDDKGSGSGGGGGSSTSDYSSMFEKLPIDSTISDFADRLKAAFQAGDWKELGTIIGNKFNEVVDSVPWSAIGHKMGYGINGAVQTTYYTLKTADFKNFGNRIAQLLNGALSEIDFTFFGRLIVRRFTAAIDFVIGLLGGLDWGLIGKSVGDCLRGAFDETYEWITGINWSQMTHDLYSNFKKFLIGIDFASLAQSFFKALGAAFGAAVSIIATFIADVWRDITGYFSAYLTNDDGTKKCGIDWVFGILQGIWDGIKNIGKWIYDNVFRPFIQGFKDAFGIHSPSTVMAEQGKYIVEGVWQGILNAISSGFSIITDWAVKIYNWFTGGDGNGNIFQKFGNAASRIVSSFGSMIGSTYTNVKSSITTWASGVYNWFTGEDGNGNIVEKFKTTAGNIISGFSEKVGNTYSTVKSNVTTWASNVKSWFTSSSFGGVNIENFSTFANNAIEGFKSKIGSAYTNVKSNVITWASNVKTWFTSSSFGGVNMENFMTFANNTIEGFKNKVGSAYTNVKSSITTWADKVKPWFTTSSFGGVNYDTYMTYANNIITGFKNNISSKYTTVKSSITTWASKVKSWFTGSSDGGVNSNSFATYASNVITGFSNRISGTYTNVKRSITTWASNVKTWFTGSGHGDVNKSKFSTFATNVIDGFKDRISGSASNAKSAMTTFASNVKTWFTDTASYSNFYSAASDVINGFKNGIGNLYTTCKNNIQSWGSSTISWFKEKLGINSPSRVFYELAEFSVMGYNNAISKEGSTTKGIVNKWVNSFTGIKPQFAYAFAVDTSDLDYPDPDSYVKNLQADVTTRNMFTATGFKEGMKEFYRDLVEPTLTRMADDMRRQADKEEKTVVQIGHKVISDAVTTQRNADGYSFIN